ncbi:MAG: hypothetical protein J3Q66DRAFT_31655 [Benniella sp.]|nr:MAG: hypothetical protein J3Q66DRAFT_31655 [Benniella sp.]
MGTIKFTQDSCELEFFVPEGRDHHRCLCNAKFFDPVFFRRHFLGYVDWGQPPCAMAHRILKEGISLNTIYYKVSRKKTTTSIRAPPTVAGSAPSGSSAANRTPSDGGTRAPVPSRAPVLASAPVPFRAPVLASAPVPSRAPVPASAPVPARAQVLPCATAPPRAPAPVHATAPVRAPVCAPGPVRVPGPSTRTTATGGSTYPYPPPASSTSKLRSPALTQIPPTKFTNSEQQQMFNAIRILNNNILSIGLQLENHQILMEDRERVAPTTNNTSCCKKRARYILR